VTDRLSIKCDAKPVDPRFLDWKCHRYYDVDSSVFIALKMHRVASLGVVGVIVSLPGPL